MGNTVATLHKHRTRRRLLLFLGGAAVLLLGLIGLLRLLQSGDEAVALSSSSGAPAAAAAAAHPNSLHKVDDTKAKKTRSKKQRRKALLEDQATPQPRAATYPDDEDIVWPLDPDYSEDGPEPEGSPLDEGNDDPNASLFAPPDSGAAAGALAARAVPRPAVRVAVVLPYTETEKADVDRLFQTLEGWAGGDAAVSPACAAAGAGGHPSSSVGIFFYGTSGVGVDLIERLETTESTQGLTSCVRAVDALESDMGDEESEWDQKGEEEEQRRQRRLSALFYRLLLDEDGHLQDALSEYTHVLWLDWRVARPLRPRWVDAIAGAAAASDEGGAFWVRGGHYQGAALDEVVVTADAKAAEALRRLNGNALYALRDPEFETFLRIVRERRPPRIEARADAALWRVLHDLPYSWKAYQAHRPQFRHAPALLAHSEDPALLQGADAAIGIQEPAPALGPTTDDDEIIPASLKLSVLVRTFSKDLEAAAIALQSARRFLPNAIDYVAVVPEPDYQLALEKLPEFVEVKSEPILMEDQSVQQKYTKLMGDTYCAGDYILHLDSDVVFHRPLLYKDLFLLGKPTLEYQTYAELADTGVNRWQNGTAFAVGHPIVYEYSRSNEHLYPRAAYAPARAHIEQRFNGLSFPDYLATRPGSSKGKSKAGHRTLEAKYIPGGERDTHALFSDFNYMGAFLHFHMPDAVAWRYLGRDDQGMQPPETPLQQVIRPRFTCQGNGRWTEKSAKHKAEQLRHLRDIAHGKVQGCGQLYAFLESIRPKGRKGKSITEKRK